MSEYTVLRIRVGAGVAARVLGAIPGVSVVDDLDAALEDRADAAAGAGAVSETPPTASRPVDTTTRETFASEEAVAPAEDDEESASAVKKWGLLGAGVTLVAAGLGTVGFWFLKRRGSDDDGDGPVAETPPPATDTGVASAERTGSRRDATSRGKSVGGDDGGMDDTDADTGTETDAGASASSTDETSASTVLGEESSETDDAGERTHGQSYVGPTKGLGESGGETGTPTSEPEISADEDDVRTPGSVNVAPLLGVAFLAVSGAIVRWMRSGHGGER
ncbi:hypothetical protein [Haloarcula nitratireducens]|uniref:Uncharacterized protein n=1 Tax=Haloarcula nitratireducens TaxID=2487749 RepID=A0AAW4P7D6_9EURY|nr:hypothetical protein [Halomicroarcula nitratireducens]MBX0293533.1 hypothetical protein [Halomicroarcula nitratireducens]